eukprot:CAMPEP_0171957902 /NCGR_PEP_ID=MMETSP0993-20121228/134976_1 /TAXON_ID=483369 /ORGANISM="non described non described, Strain CCMP2098" /LENGTH=39 /DNA_ID= /DNA_START= /DNA_END= /DNA_ORIENTATION=
MHKHPAGQKTRDDTLRGKGSHDDRFIVLGPSFSLGSQLG